MKSASGFTLAQPPIFSLYDDYHSSDFGLFLDMLRYDGIGHTSSNDVAEWAKRHGCFVTEEENKTDATTGP